MKTVLVPIANNVEDIETVTIIDVLRRAGAKVTVASIHEKQITASKGVNIVSDCLLDECLEQEFDLIALPGGMPGAEHFRDSTDLVDLLKKQKKADRLYAAICASPALVFQKHGLLEGKKATCYPFFHNELEDQSSISSRVLVDGNCITSKGPGTAMEFSLKLVELLFGSKKASQVAESMLVLL